MTDDFLDRDGNDARTTFLGQPITWTNGAQGATIEFQSSHTFLGGRWWSTTDNNTGITWEAIEITNGQYKLHRTQPEDNGWEYLYVGLRQPGDYDHQRVANNGRCKEDDNGNNNFETWAQGTWMFITPEDYEAYYVKTLDETAATAPSSATDVKVVFNRTMIPNVVVNNDKGINTESAWNTICFPFDLTEQQIKDLFGTNVVVKELDDATPVGDSFSLKFKAVTSIEANKPYIMQIKASDNKANNVYYIRDVWTSFQIFPITLP